GAASPGRAARCLKRIALRRQHQPSTLMRGTPMPITPWRATCIQMPSRVATGSASRADARQIVHHNLETAERMIDAVLAAPETRDSRLLLLPEFGFQGPPLKENVQEWIYLAQWPSPHDMMDAYLERYGVEGTFPVVDTELGRIAMFPCGEVSTPEAARMFMLRGAEILLHPDNGGTGAAADAVMVARAYE